MKLASLLFFLAGTLTVGYFFYDQYYDHEKPYKVLIDVPGFENNHPDRIQTIELTDLYNAGTKFSDLAEEGFYTVITVRSIDCKVCMAMEVDYSKLLDSRPDIKIYKINIPSKHIQFYRGSEQEKFEEDMQAAKLKYDIKSPPQVIIFQPNKSIFQNSRHGDEAGQILLQKWIERVQ